MEIKLKYGKSFVELNIPDRNVFGFFTPPEPISEKSNNEILDTAFENSFGEKLEIFCQNKDVNLLMSDASRSIPFEDLADAILNRLISANLVRCFICTGTHNSDTPENQELVNMLKTCAEKFGIKEFKIILHDCTKSNFVHKGITSRKTEVDVNAWLDGGDMFVVASDVKPHYFAGYSNPVKNFFPGCATFVATEQNHSIALDDNSSTGRHPLHPDPDRRNNPLANDQYEAMKFIVEGRPVFAICIFSNGGKVIFAKCGELEQTITETIKIVDEFTSFNLESADAIIVSPGGFPDDESLYMSQRALELTKKAVKQAGCILFVSECSNGIGAKRTREHFYDKLTLPLEDVLQTVQDEYKLYSHKAYKFAKMIMSVKEIFVYSKLSSEEIKNIHLTPTDNPQAVVDGWIKENPDIKIYVFDGANKLAVY